MTVRLRRASLALLGSLALLRAASPAAAQLPLTRTDPDSLGFSADTVRVSLTPVEGMEGCELVGHAVVKGRAELRRLRRFPQCAKVAPSLAGRTLVGVRVHADCQAFYRLDAFRSAKRREFRVRVLIHGGGCRGMLSEYEWLALPALPRGWSVRFTETDDRSEPFDLRRWIPLDASRN
jgi:hypothetical protein